MRRLMAGAAAGAVGLAYVQVSSVPSTAAPQATYDWDTVVSTTIADARGFAANAREEVRWWKATYVRMSNDTDVLRSRLTVSSIESSGN